MEQHPVPQQIASYQFKLVGDMTLRQFFQVAGGALVALLIYASPLPAFFKWPLIVFFVLMGAALAFLPIEERPLDVWLRAFFRSVYSPTLYFWNKPSVPVKYFVDATPTTTPTTPAPVVPTPHPVDTSKGAFLARLEEGEKDFLSKFGMHANSAAAMPVMEQTKIDPQPIKPTPVAIPQTKPQAVYQAQTPAVTQAPQPMVLGNAQTSPVEKTLQSQQISTSHAAQFSPDAAPPHPPTQANIIVGQVMDSQGKIAEGAILEVRDLQGRPVRALRSNKAGHFLIVTPLANGKYELIIEKEGLIFDPLTFEARGTVISPMAIRAK